MGPIKDVEPQVGIPTMSINQMAEFVAATERGKRAIVRKQKHPSTFRVARYATARASFKNYCKNDFDEAILLQGLEKLQNKTPVSQWAASEKSCSIQAIRGFMQSHFPERFGRIKCSFFTPREKQIRFGGLTLVVAPDLIFHWEEDGTRYIGCLKLRIKKKAAEFGVYRRIASLLAHYLRCIAADDEVVVNNFCLCYNAMDGNIIPAPRDLQSDMEDLRIASEQIVELWNVA